MTLTHQIDDPAPAERHALRLDKPLRPPLSCLAGFYDNEAQARQALRQVRQTQGLLPSQSVLLSPDDAGSLRFARLSRLWAADHGFDGRHRNGDAWLAGALGASLAVLAALALLRAGARQSDTWQVVMLLTALALGSLLGAGLFALWVRPRPTRRFDVQVHRQLCLGYWALVTHRVPWAGQADVVRLLRGTSRRWCADVPRARRS